MTLTPEVIATLVASFGAIMAALFGIYRASKGNGSPPPSNPGVSNVAHMMDQYLTRLLEIERGVDSAVSILRDIRQALEGTGHRQEKMVDELEGMSRTMTRIEMAQGSGAQAIAAMKHHEEMQVSILAQIREEIKGLREGRYPSHRSS